MSAIIILIACSLIVALGFLIAFIVSSRNGQFDDMETPAMRILFDDATPIVKTKAIPETISAKGNNTHLNSLKTNPNNQQ